MDQSWKRWIERNGLKLTGGYEREFAQTVFPRLTEIVPTDVIPQYGFVDADGKQRYIDFVIKNNTKGYLIPIELDGLAKDETHDKWNTFLRRQNDMVVRVAPPLRFTNSQLHHELDAVLRRIRSYLQVQARRNDESQALAQELASLRERLAKSETTLAIAKGQLGSQTATGRTPAESDFAKLEEVNSELKQLLADAVASQQQLDESTQAALFQLEQRVASADEQLVKEKREAMLNVKWFVGGVTVVAVAAMAFVATSSQPTSMSQMIQASPVAQTASETPPSKVVSQIAPVPMPAVMPATRQAPSPIPAPAPVVTKVAPSAQPGQIRVEESAQFIGQQVQTCSTVASIKRFSSGVYINLGLRFPKQHATLLLWDQVVAPLESRYGTVESLLGKTICAKGLMDQDKEGRPRIQVRSLDQVTLKNLK